MQRWRRGLSTSAKSLIRLESVIEEPSDVLCVVLPQYDMVRELLGTLPCEIADFTLKGLSQSESIRSTFSLAQCVEPLNPAVLP